MSAAACDLIASLTRERLRGGQSDDHALILLLLRERQAHRIGFRVVSDACIDASVKLCAAMRLLDEQQRTIARQQATIGELREERERYARILFPEAGER